MPSAASNRQCDWCKTTYVVPSLARICEDKHMEEIDEDPEEPDSPGR